MELSLLLQIIVQSVAHGSIYALIGVGLVLIFRATDLINFAQGQLVMTGAYIGITLTLYLRLPFVVALVLTLVIVAVLGVLIEWIICRRLMRAPMMNMIIATFALGIILQNAVILIYGPEVYSMPSYLPTHPIDLGGVIVSVQTAFVVVVTLVVIGALFVFLGRTRLGMAMQATAENRVGAALVGISVKRVFSGSWMLSAFLSALAGQLLAPILLVEPNMGIIAIKSFSAAIIGGFNLPATVLGGYLVSLLENLFGVYVNVALKDAAAFIIIILVLLMRPEGLFGRQVRRRV
jgi:branched-chain amino acid transport system permease protein